MLWGELPRGPPKGGVHSARSASGQASVDYVAALALVAVVFAMSASAVGAPWLPLSLAEAIRHGICVVSGSLCTPAEARRAGLDPCPVHRRSVAERAGATAVLHLGRGDSMVVERFSDGRARVTFVDGGEVGGTVGVGLDSPLGPSASGRAGLGVAFNRGRVYEFADWARAQRFLARFARTETMTGEGRRALQALCLRCPEWLEGRAAPRLPEPDATFLEGGTYGDLSAQAGLALPAGRRTVELEAELEAGGVELLGRRRSGRRTTWYLRLEGSASAELGAVLGALTAADGGEAALELTVEDRRPVSVTARVAAHYASRIDLVGTGLDTGDVVDRLTAAAAAPAEPGDGGGVGVEASLALDLTDPANAGAVLGALVPGQSTLLRAEALAALGRRLDVAGELDLRTYRTTRAADGHELGGGQVLYVGAGYAKTESSRRLISAWSGRPGELRRREDCEAAARSAAA